MAEIVLDCVENIVGKGKKAGFLESFKPRIVWLNGKICSQDSVLFFTGNRLLLR